VVVSIDVYRSPLGRYSVYTRNGSRDLGIDPSKYAKRMEDLGAGEILLNSINADGTRNGYDLQLVNTVSSGLNIPVVACGGAGHLDHFRQGIASGASAVAAGSLFVFHGKLHSVLITYPTPQEIRSLSL
jgi:cyclase